MYYHRDCDSAILEETNVWTTILSNDLGFYDFPSTSYSPTWNKHLYIKYVKLQLTLIVCRQGSYRYKRGTTAVLSTVVKKIPYDVVKTDVIGEAMDTAWCWNLV